CSSSSRRRGSPSRRGSRSAWPCSASICSATHSVTRSTRACVRGSVLRARDVIRLHMGHYTVPLDFPRAPDLQGAAIVVEAFLIRHPSGPILLDTGLVSGHAKAEELFHPVIRPFDDVLREVSLRPEETRAVANCHLHIDHSVNFLLIPRPPRSTLFPYTTLAPAFIYRTMDR